MHVFTDEMMQALCWTLIHSLWQGLIAAIVAGVVITLTKRSSSFLRYNSLAVLFVLFMVTTCCTFVLQLNHRGGNQQAGKTAPSNTDIQIYNAGTTQVNGIGNSFTENFVGYFNQHAALIVAIWFIVLSARFVKLIADAGYIQRVKHYKTHLPSRYWQHKMIELAERLQIKRRVILLESEIIKVPMVAGFLKPIILFPFALLSQLPIEQVESVLLHELAHIKRKDYFINILQSFAEALFFFNPGVRWISSLIREERENCCDDIAIGETGNKKEFVHALVSFQEYNAMDISKYGMAFPGRKNHLLNRVTRIITNNNKTLNNMEKIFLACCFAIAGIFTLAFSTSTGNAILKAVAVNKTPATQTFKAMPDQVVTATRDTLPVTEKSKEYISRNGEQTTFYKKGYKIVCEGDHIVSLHINGKKIPGDKIKDYQAVADEMMQEIKQDMSVQSEQLDRQEDLLKLKQEELDKQMEMLKKNEENISLERLNSISEDGKEKLKLEEELVNKNVELKKLQELITNGANSQTNEQKTEMLKLQHAQLKLVLHQLSLEQQKLNLALADKVAVPELAELKHALIVESVSPVSPLAPVKEDKTIVAIIDELINEKIITDREHLSFTLNEEKLEVNGVIQSEALHLKLKEKYLKGTNEHIKYSRNKSGTHTDIIINR